MSAPRTARRLKVSLSLAAIFYLALHLSASAQRVVGAPLPAPRLQPDKPPVWSLPEAEWPRAIFPDISAQLADVRANGFHGVLFETLDGRVVKGQNVHQFFNPASATKLATALAAMKTFGPQHRFSTVLWTNGVYDAQTGTITGDLYLSGRDPAFHDEHAVTIAQELNRLGIKTVTGDLLVPFGFSMNFSSSAQRSGERFYDTLDATRRPPAATRAWLEERVALSDTASLQAPPPSVAVMGGVGVEAVPAGARTLLTHRSSKLTDILKVMLCYSNNFMAERVGDALGGPRGIERVLTGQYGVAPGDVRLSSASGLGAGRITPRAMMKVYRALLNELSAHRLAAADILPVGGIDPGTLEKRFTSPYSRGSVIAKTGTLPRTGGGVSTLVGQTRTRDGSVLLFVIFNERGSVWRFRESQDALVTAMQHLRGGPISFNYRPQALAMRLAGTEIDPSQAEEFEPAAN